MPGTIIIDKMHRKFLSAYDNWINLWLGCISIYLLSLEEFSYIIPSEQMEELNEVIHSTARLFDYVQTI